MWPMGIFSKIGPAKAQSGPSPQMVHISTEPAPMHIILINKHLTGTPQGSVTAHQGWPDRAHANSIAARDWFSWQFDDFFMANLTGATGGMC